MKKVISKIGLAAVIASMGALLFTGCDNSDVSGRTLSREDYRGYQGCPRIYLDWGATTKAGTGYAEKVSLPFYPPYGGVTITAEYTGDFSYDVDRNQVTLLSNSGPFKRGYKVNCVRYDEMWDAFYVNNVMFR